MKLHFEINIYFITVVLSESHMKEIRIIINDFVLQKSPYQRKNISVDHDLFANRYYT